MAESVAFEAPGTEIAAVDLDFVEDHPRDGLTSFLNRLEPHERDALYQMIDAEIRAEVTQELATENERWREQAHAFLERVAKQLETKVDDELTAVARNAVELSVAMAEQIMRRSIELDESTVLRAVETIIYRAKRGTKFTVIANPADREFLLQLPENLKPLNIETIEADQRIERGGCVITADGQEWDYTVGGRFEKLSETVRESILEAKATQEDPD